MIKKIRMFLCNVLGWHRPSKEIEVYRGIKTSICKYCKQEIIQDSQGNWF